MSWVLQTVLKIKRKEKDFILSWFKNTFSCTGYQTLSRIVFHTSKLLGRITEVSGIWLYHTSVIYKSARNVKQIMEKHWISPVNQNIYSELPIGDHTVSLELQLALSPAPPIKTQWAAHLYKDFIYITPGHKEHRYTTCLTHSGHCVSSKMKGGQGCSLTNIPKTKCLRIEKVL